MEEENKLIISLPDNSVALSFATWPCEQGEQDFFDWAKTDGIRAHIDYDDRGITITGEFLEEEEED